MDLTTIGIFLGFICLIVTVASAIKTFQQRGIGAKILMGVITIGIGILLFVMWHRPSDNFLSIAIELVFTFSIGFYVALLAWIALCHLGIAGDGGFASEDARTISSYDKERSRNKLPEMNIEVGNLLELGILNDKKAKEANGVPIIWRVLDIQDNKALLIAEQYISLRTYDDNLIGETSASPWIGDNNLRPWLNNDFLKKSFSEEERLRMALSDTNDYVFCLSIDEAERYFSSNADRRIDHIYEYYQSQMDDLVDKRNALKNEDNPIDKAGSMIKKMGS